MLTLLAGVSINRLAHEVEQKRVSLTLSVCLYQGAVPLRSKSKSREHQDVSAHTSLHVSTSVSLPTSMCVYIYIYMHTCMYVCMHVCIYLHACMHTCMNTYIYNTYIHTYGVGVGSF
jgi:hypothetical protein